MMLRLMVVRIGMIGVIGIVMLTVVVVVMGLLIFRRIHGRQDQDNKKEKCKVDQKNAQTDRQNRSRKWTTGKVKRAKVNVDSSLPTAQFYI